MFVVSFGKITKKSQLISALSQKDSIIVFDEFDLLLDVLVNKNEKEKREYPKHKKTDLSKLLSVVEGDERKQVLEMIKDEHKKCEEDDNLDLSYLLQKLDGLEDSSGRLIIATTNHPENINPALLRPGRFDLKLCLGNCSKKMLSDILSSYFNEEIQTELIENIPEFKWSPLEVINACILYHKIENVVDHLERKCVCV